MHRGHPCVETFEHLRRGVVGVLGHAIFQRDAAREAMWVQVGHAALQKRIRRRSRVMVMSIDGGMQMDPETLA